MKNIKIYPDPEALSKAAAEFFTSVAIDSVKRKGNFSVALSGGNSPKHTYELLASHPFVNRIPWEKTYVFWGDERFVPSDDPQNNARMAREALLDLVPVPADHIFPIPTDGTPAGAADRYTVMLNSFFHNHLPKFDLIFLGLGENGHTASLFPGTEVLEEKARWVAPVYVEDRDQYRITLTVPVINNAEKIVFLAYGEAKAAVLSQVFTGAEQPQQVPAQLVNPTSGSLYWYIDEEAGKLLDEHILK